MSERNYSTCVSLVAVSERYEALTTASVAVNVGLPFPANVVDAVYQEWFNGASFALLWPDQSQQGGEEQQGEHYGDSDSTKHENTKLEEEYNLCSEHKHRRPQSRTRSRKN